MAELWRLDAAALVDGYRAGEFTPVDALNACESRVAHCRPIINAMVARDRDAAHLAAAASSRRWRRGVPLSPLDGVPISIKDNMHVAGWPTSWGSRLLRGFVATNDELPVARLRASGAVFFGKTNLPEFAMQGYTANGVFGATRNPWDATLWPGGSSGGSAAAVACGCGPLALATDGGGSIRRPASHCGLVGFKPSAGRVLRRNGLPAIFLDFEQVGAIGRSTRAVRDVMGVIAEADLRADAPRNARILFVPRFAHHAVDDGIAASVREAALQLEALGHRVDEASSFDLAEEVNARWPLLSAAGLAWLVDSAPQWLEFGLQAGQPLDISACGDAARASLLMGQSDAATALFQVMDSVSRLIRSLGECFEDHDFILTPATEAMPRKAEDAFPTDING